ncbi:ABC transporter ATP-binding protein [Peptoniphilus mikwangii]|uniref:ABC transporter ATP-binding protein n=1 Tax=Peptoniphilus mikwangii TaxID=1354300 RepID=UPI0003FD4C4F|nr:ATP-binding cassette domain-containing protein [Peptoniphilus mikwangii]
MDNFIELTNLKKNYGKNTVVDIDNMKIPEESIYGLIGPNGAGKSTTMKMICGLTVKDEGIIRIAGEEFNDNNRLNMLKNIGSLIEGPAYYNNLTAYDNLDIVRELKGLKKTDIDDVIDIVGLKNNIKKRVKNYSLGMKQRLAIAMALMGFPKLIILDEPTNGLDPHAMEDIRNLIRNLPKKYGCTVMVSSHILDEIEKVADKIGIIGNGKMLYQGTISEFKSNYRGEIKFRTSDNNRATKILDNINFECDDEFIKIKYV